MLQAGALSRRGLRLLPAALLLAALAGCAARPPATAESYRLARIDGGDFLLSPESARAKGLIAQVDLGAVSGAGPNAGTAACSIAGQWFSLRSEKRGGSPRWIAGIPQPEAWQGKSPVYFNSRWDRFVDSLSSLQQKGCYSQEGFLAVKARIAQALSFPMRDTLFYRYSFGSSGGFLDLTSGMRLQIDRFIFRKGPGGETRGKYLGRRSAEYRIAAKADGGTRLVLLRMKGSKGLSRKSLRGLPEATLAPQFASDSVFRLFFRTLFAPSVVERKAVLVGAGSSNALVAATRLVMRNPRIACRELERVSVDCASFNGRVTVNAYLALTVNGHLSLLPVTSTLRTAMKSVPAADLPAALRTLHILRLYHGRYVDVRFDRSDPKLSGMVLLGGDKISWSLKRASQ